MEKVILGNTKLKVGRINLGGNVFGWTLNEQQSFNILDSFIDGGFNFLDTADTYSWWVDGNVGGESEAIIGKWVQQRRNRHQLVIATKVGSQNRTHPVDISRAYILKSIDESLQRLRTDYIDLYYTHFDDGKTPIEETLSTYQDLIKAGKIRYVGVSNISPARLTESLEIAKKTGLPRYEVLQPHYNLAERSQYETMFASIANMYDMSVLPYWSLASGFLTGKYRSRADLEKSVRGGDVKKYLNLKGLGILNALDTVAARYRCRPATIALAWLLAQPCIAAPVVSATSQSQLEMIFAATRLHLDDDDLNLLTTASD
ncbi:MAG: aldo/keto reductase [Niabella sp.]